MKDQQAGRVAEAVLNLAVTIRDEGPDAVRAAAERALKAAGGDPVAAIAIAAALVRVDEPADTWWAPPAPPVAVARPRRQRTRPGATRQLAPCGTHAAFVRHKAHGEEPDHECVIAERAYQRDRHSRAHGHRGRATGQAA